MKIKDKFNKEQINLLKEIGVMLEDREYSDSEIISIDNKVTECFQQEGIEKDDKLNKKGLICESILDVISEL